MKSLLNILITIIAAALLTACSGKPESKPAQLETLKKQQAELTKKIEALEKEVAAENPEALAKVKMKEVAAITLAPRSFDHYVQTQGSIVSIDNIQLSAKSPGVVTHVYAREGESIAQGQILAQVDNSLILRGIDELKAQLDLATNVFTRQKNLWDQKIGTEIQYLQAKSNKESLERRLATMQEQNEMTKLKSPINGTVEAVNIKLGENVAPGAPAFRVINTSDLKAAAKISESYITSIKKGDKVSINFPDLNQNIDAKVTFVGRNIDALTRSFPVEVKLPSSAYLRPNMTVVMKVVFHTEPAALCVPINVVQDVNNQKIVYTAESDGKNLVARRKVVEVSGVFGPLAEIKSGLKAGDEVITVGYQGLNDGELIKK